MADLLHGFIFAVAKYMYSCFLGAGEERKKEKHLHMIFHNN